MSMTLPTNCRTQMRSPQRDHARARRTSSRTPRPKTKKLAGAQRIPPALCLFQPSQPHATMGEEPCRCFACMRETRRSSLQEMVNLSGAGAASLLEQIQSKSERVGESPVCIRASLASKKEALSTLNEDEATSTACPPTPRASCSPFIETTDPDAPIMNSLVKPKSPAATRPPPSDSPKQPHINKLRLVTSEDDIELTGRDLGPEDIPAIAELLRPGRVKRLNLAKNNLGDQGVAELVEILLRGSTKLEYLSLADNGVGESGGLAIVPLIAKQTNLHSLFLCSNNVGPTATAAILAANSEREFPMKGLCGLVMDGS